MPHNTPDKRLSALTQWVCAQRHDGSLQLRPITNDASFRRYFRLRHQEQDYIAMDAPPDRENVRPFIDVAQRLRAQGFNAPEILHQDVEQGFLLLSDLGDRLYLPALNADTVEALYGDALRALSAIQRNVSAEGLPPYDDALLKREMRLFPEWYLTRHLGLELDAAQIEWLEQAFDTLSRAVQQQPQVFVHRDFHARNLLVTPQNNPGILDFQDAVRGPITYDLVSLLRDVYLQWPPERVRDWVLGYRASCVRQGLLAESVDEAEFIRWVDWMGAQRHLKIAGIFARLYYRDGKAGYLKDIPLTLTYLRQELAPYPEFAELLAWIQTLESRG